MAATDVTLSSTLKATTGFNRDEGMSGEAITAGQVVYRDSTASYKFKKAICTSLAAASAVGIALSTAAGADQPIIIMKAGDITNVSGLTQGEAYFVSDTTAGALMKYSDIGAGEYATYVGHAPTTTTFKVAIVLATAAHS